MSENERVGEYLEVLKGLRDERPDDIMEECTHYVLPSRDMWQDNDNVKPKKQGEDIYDSRPVANNQILANGMVGYNAGPASPWFRLKMASDDLNEIPFVKDWLEDSEKRIYIILAATNFYDALTEFYLDLGSVGTATQIIEEHPQKGIIFSTRHPKETFMLEGPDGRVDSIYRDVWLTGRQALNRYGDKLSDTSQNLFSIPSSLSKKYLFLHIVQPRYDRDIYSSLNINMPFASVEIYPDEEKILTETGFEEFPGVVGRWRKNSNQTYGISPAMDAMVDIKRANLMKKTMLDAAQLATDPPIQLPREMARKLDMKPGGRNTYKSPDRGINAVQIGAGYPFTRDVLDGTHEDIDEHFFTDLFKMLARSQREMTAREVAERQGERVTGLSGPLTRQNAEVLSPAVKRVFNIAMRNGWLKPPPPALLETGIPIDVDFIGLLSMAQKQYYQANGMNRGIALISGIAEATQNPGVWDNVNTDELVRYAIDSEGFPQKSIEERPIVEKKRKQRAEAMAKQQAMEQASQAADMVPKLGKAPEKGSPGEEISKRLAGGA